MRHSFLPAQNLWVVCAELKISVFFFACSRFWGLIGCLVFAQDFFVERNIHRRMMFAQDSWLANNRWMLGTCLGSLRCLCQAKKQWVLCVCSGPSGQFYHQWLIDNCLGSWAEQNIDAWTVFAEDSLAKLYISVCLVLAQDASADLSICWCFVPSLDP